MTEPLVRPKRKDPLKRTRLPLSPQARSRTAFSVASAAAEDRFAAGSARNARDDHLSAARHLSHGCFAKPPFCDVRADGELIHDHAIRTSTDSYYRERMPQRRHGQ